MGKRKQKKGVRRKPTKIPSAPFAHDTLIRVDLLRAHSGLGKFVEKSISFIMKMDKVLQLDKIRLLFLPFILIPGFFSVLDRIINYFTNKPLSTPIIYYPLIMSFLNFSESIFNWIYEHGLTEFYFTIYLMGFSTIAHKVKNQENQLIQQLTLKSIFQMGFNFFLMYGVVKYVTPSMKIFLLTLILLVIITTPLYIYFVRRYKRKHGEFLNL